MMASFLMSAIVTNAQKWEQKGKFFPDVWEEALPADNTGYGKKFDVDGDVAVVAGANKKVFVFHFNGTEWVEKGELTTSELKSQFGHAVAIKGNVVLVSDYTKRVGSLSAAGAVYVYELSGDASEWTGMEEATAMWEGPKRLSYFGTSIDIEDNTIAVGAIGYAHPNPLYSVPGTVSVYQRGDENWSSDMTPEVYTDPGASSFGFSVALANDVMVVGARAWTENGVKAGAAFVLKREGTLWADTDTISAQLMHKNGMPGDNFGTSVAVLGNDVVVGAPGVDIPANASGQIYIFEDAVSTTGKLTESATLSNADFSQPAGLGNTLAVEGNTVVAGAPNYSAVNFYEKPETGWPKFMVESGQISSSNPEKDGNFGSYVSLAGDRLFVGAPSYDNTDAFHPGTNMGIVYLYNKPANGWTGDIKLNGVLKSSEVFTNGGEGFGKAIDIDGDYAVVGSTGKPERVYVYKKQNETWSKIAVLTTSEVGDFNFGGAVAIEGDVIAVGAYNTFIEGTTDKGGAVFIFKKTGDEWTDMTETFKLQPNGLENLDYFGFSLDMEGNVLAVGSYGDDDVNRDAGAVYVFENSGSSWSAESLTLTKKLKQKPHEQLGTSNNLARYSVKIEGGYIFASSTNYDLTASFNEGVVLVFGKDGTSWSTADSTEVARLYVNEAERSLALGYAMDVDGDYVYAGTNKDKVFMFKMPQGGWTGDVTESAVFLPSEGITPSQFGWYLSVSGEFLAISDHTASDTLRRSGAVHIYRMPEAGWLAENVEDYRLKSDHIGENDGFGNNVKMNGATLWIGESADSQVAIGTGSVSAFHFRFPTSARAPQMDSDIMVYPNPFNDMLVLEGTQDVSRVVMRNIVGSVVKVVEVNDPQVRISTSELARGVYFVQCFEGDKLVQATKVIRQ